MVDVGAKLFRTARLLQDVLCICPPKCLVNFPGAIFKQKKVRCFKQRSLQVLWRPKTGDLIPLCHPLGLEHCNVHISMNGQNELVIDCTASITAKTGIEMEALVGASIAALTVYDM